MKRLLSRGPHREWLGDSLTWLCGGALALCLLLIAGLLALLAVNGLSYFWPRPVEAFTLRDGSRLLGEVHQREERPPRAGEDPSARPIRLQIRTGNRDLGDADFRWIDEAEIVSRTRPVDVVVFERLEWGNFYGRVTDLRKGGAVLASGAEAWSRFLALQSEKRADRERLRAIERSELGRVNRELERFRLARRRLELRHPTVADRAVEERDIAAGESAAKAEYDRLASELEKERAVFAAETVVVEAADGRRKEWPVGAVVRAFRPNVLSWLEQAEIYASRIGEFVFDDPRESNTEGGIFPAIFGTVLMVFLMSLAAVPMGVLAALYLREYAKQGAVVRLVRIAVNNLAGVPSIVFGMFGLGFFVYGLGGSIDRHFFPEFLPTPTFGAGGVLWASLTLAMLTVPVVIVATEEGLAAVPRIVREGSLALGATKFETTWRIVIPAAAPGILTGMILAMARAAGEVAPLMIVGMVKLAPSLPVDLEAPFLHLDRKFMHLGFHIYDVGFQSPNVEATKPLVFATALLLIGVVTAMNLMAIALRQHLRRKHATHAV